MYDLFTSCWYDHITRIILIIDIYVGKNKIILLKQVIV